MLIAAIWQRVNQYGITEPRYFLAVLAFWLAGVALYYAVTASRRIRLIPETLCLVAIIALLGPWSAYDVSRRSQLSRLRGLLTEHGLLDGSRVVPAIATADVDFADRKEIAGAVRYLVRKHGSRSLARISPQLRETAMAVGPVDPLRYDRDSVARGVVNSLGIQYVAQWETPADSRYLSFGADPYNSPVDVTGWDLLQRVQLPDTFTVATGPDTLTFTWAAIGPALHVTLRGQPVLAFPLDTLLVLAADADPSTPGGAPRRPAPVGTTAPLQPRDPIQLFADGGGYRMSLIIRRYAGISDSTGQRITNGEGDILVARAPGQPPSREMP
jgi:hypothetical protein